MALVDDDEVEEVAGELVVDRLVLLVAHDRLVEREVDLVGLVDPAAAPVDELAGELRHRLAERLEVVDDRLVDEDVAVGEEQHPLGLAALPEPPDDVERRVRLAGAGRHHEQDPVLALGDGLDRAVDRELLVVAGRLAADLAVVR